MMIARALTAFVADRRAASAVEFAVIGPVLALMTLAIVDAWSLGSSVLNMRASLEAGATYFLKGGTDEATAQAISLAQWEGKPPDASVTVVQSCKCGEVAADCSVLCASTSAAPAAYMNLSATGSWKAIYDPFNLADNISLSTSRTIRLR